MIPALQGKVFLLLGLIDASFIIGVGLAMLLHKAGEPLAQIATLWIRSLPPRQSQYILDDTVNTQRMVLDDGGETPVSFRQTLGFTHQLGSVADCAQWITYLVGNICCQLPERSQLQLLCSLRDLPCILDKDQHQIIIRVFQTGKIELDFRAALFQLQGMRP